MAATCPETHAANGFFNPDQFDCLRELRDNWQVILDEFNALDQRAEIHPWPETNLFQMKDEQTQMHVPGQGWNVFGLYAFGKKKTYNCSLCPKTAAIIDRCKVPLTTVAFSILKPTVHILPHSGYLGYSDRILRAHICLQAPSASMPDNIELSNSRVLSDKLTQQQWYDQSIFPYSPSSDRKGCMFRVESTGALWRPGYCLVFDDTLTHEAWNFTSEPRTNLLVDFPRPTEYTLPEEVIEENTESEASQPFMVGSRGNTYLDQLTDQHGWESSKK